MINKEKIPPVIQTFFENLIGFWVMAYLIPA